MKNRILLVIIVLICSVFYYYNYNYKVIVDYDLSNGKEKSISFLNYYIAYKSGEKYDKKIININKNIDSSIVIKIKEIDSVMDYVFYTNKHNIIFRIFQKEANDECGCVSLKDITVYAQNKVFSFTAINGDYFDKGICYSNSGKNLYVSEMFILKTKIKLEQVRELDFNFFLERNKELIDTIYPYGKIELDTENNIFYEKENNGKIKVGDLMNAQSLNSPFFHISGDLEYFNYLKSSENSL